MTATSASPASTLAPAAIPTWITLLLAIACGAIVANLYYAQPLIGLISATIHLSPAAGGLVVTLSQIGYCLGLLFVVPLGDLIENRRLVVIALIISVIALIAAALSQNAWQFLLAALAIGVSSVAAQVLVPYATYLAAPEKRGQVVGNVMSGLLLGILLARPMASLIANFWGWHAVFAMSAVVICVLAIVLTRHLPPRYPTSGMAYGRLLHSMWGLLTTTPILRRRAAYHALLFSVFSMFWTVVPMVLTGPMYKLSQFGIALFALAGVMGAIAAPIAGRLADRGLTRPATGVAIVLVLISYPVAHIGTAGSHFSLGMLVVSALLLDMGISANLVLGQRAIFSLGGEVRSRLNGLYMAIFFAGGAVGSAVGGWAYAHGGWNLVSWFGLAMPLVALLYFFTELKKESPSSANLDAC
ncbi:MFS transporter [Glaciimonas sp. CA11.2]|uniref:MFS transporter n=1 Tax=unclassified Glaciimonas TaxID=2644401 RepID=UPI002AB5D216|nr:MULTISPECIES: MFS transporter [unclassified Glaciimonas]MDY7546646.1 MFS transporter [Glaciimonas sp. CA11.2]MEB0011771.1 MFS transporter [Glaciimonas sp. Cout2]MEB0080673.1 MFS transporter [Glaciimonas sp. Gout2]MEB0161888.1 MFS transporter [Glaciimonas sp. CA11.2]